MKFRGFVVWLLAAVLMIVMSSAGPAPAGNLTSQQVLNKVLVDDNGDALNANLSEQQALNTVLSEDGSALKIRLEGGGGGGDIKALRSGLEISKSDNTKLYIGPGSVDIAGAQYEVSSRLTKDCATTALYQTWNPDDNTTTLSNGNLTSTGIVNSYRGVRSITYKSSGKWYWEITVDTAIAGYFRYIGANSPTGDLHFPTWGVDTQSWATTGDIIGVAVDLDAGKLWLSLNGVWRNSGDPVAGTNPAFDNLTGNIYAAWGGRYDHSLTANFGASTFSYSAPSGFNSGWYDQALSASTKYFVYTTAPGSGAELSFDQISVSESEPSWSSTYGYYHNESHGRWIGSFETDADGHIVAESVQNTIPRFKTDGSLKVASDPTDDYGIGNRAYNDGRYSKQIKALRSGFNISRKDNTNIYIGPGSVDIAGAQYEVASRLTKDCATSAPVYATWNPDDKATEITLSNGNLTATSSYSKRKVRATIGHNSGKHYFEYTITTFREWLSLGVANSSMSLTGNDYIGDDANGWGYMNQGQKRHDGVNTSYGSTYTTDVIGVAVDFSSGKIWWSKNGVWQASGDPANGTNPAFTSVTGSVFPAITIADEAVITANFGAAAFSYSVPSGFNSGWYDASLNASTLYYIYVSAPAPGAALAADNVTIATVEPVEIEAYGYPGHATHGRWIGSFVTDADGYIVDPVQAPSEFLKCETDGTIAPAIKRRVASKTLTDSGFTVLPTDTARVFNIGITGLSDNAVVSLPAATGSGATVGFFINDGDDTYDVRVDPDGTDRIIGTSADGDYLGADDSGDFLKLLDVGDGVWGVVGKVGVWTEE